MRFVPAVGLVVVRAMGRCGFDDVVDRKTLYGCGLSVTSGLLAVGPGSVVAGVPLVALILVLSTIGAAMIRGFGVGYASEYGGDGM